MIYLHEKTPLFVPLGRKNNALARNLLPRYSKCKTLEKTYGHRWVPWECELDMHGKSYSRSPEGYAFGEKGVKKGGSLLLCSQWSTASALITLDML